MTDKVTPPPTTSAKKAGNVFLKAIGDLCILALLLAGAGAGGYFWGLHQQLAPIEKVGPGTPGAMLPAGTSSLPPPKSEAPAKETPKPKPAESTETDSSSSEEHAAKKYWLISSGVDYVGYSITVKVNGKPTDNFFGPGKLVDITPLIKSGDNKIVFDAKQLGESYNKHGGDASSKLTVKLVAAPHITDDFKKSDVVLTYTRSATDTEDSADNFNFKKE